MVEVAEAAKVSIFTVSAVVNGTSTVSDALRVRTERAIREIGYKRNDVARSLKTGKTKTVGVSVGDITNSFYTDVVSIIQRELHRAGYAVMLCCNDSNVVLQDEQVALMRDRMVDGLIISPTGDDIELRKVVSQTDIPFVLIDRILKGVDCDVVVLDNKAAVMEAARYLIGLGHRRIGFISGMLDSYPGRERLAGYRAALGEAGFPRDDALVELGNFPAEGARKAAIRLLTGPTPPTAILAVNNQTVFGVMRALRDLDKKCPEDISVVGFDDFPWADSFRPRLTTVAQPMREFGASRGRLVHEQMIKRPIKAVLVDLLVSKLQQIGKRRAPVPILGKGLSRCRVGSSRFQMNVASGSNAHGGAPCLEGLGAEPTLRCRRDQMATDVESVIDRSMCRKESLSRPG
jgi:LacI family transcriptional regulator